MSHDRGCHCGREKYEYADCEDESCIRNLEKTLARHKAAYEAWAASQFSKKEMG